MNPSRGFQYVSPANTFPTCHHHYRSVTHPSIHPWPIHPSSRIHPLPSRSPPLFVRRAAAILSFIWTIYFPLHPSPTSPAPQLREFTASSVVSRWYRSATLTQKSSTPQKQTYRTTLKKQHWSFKRKLFGLWNENPHALCVLVARWISKNVAVNHGHNADVWRIYRGSRNELCNKKKKIFR